MLPDVDLELRGGHADGLVDDPDPVLRRGWSPSAPHQPERGGTARGRGDVSVARRPRRPLANWGRWYDGGDTERWSPYDGRCSWPWWLPRLEARSRARWTSVRGCWPWYARAV